MTRRCSLCSSPGHSKRTCSMRTPCSGAGVKLFGVRLTDVHGIKKSASMGNLSHYSAPTAGPPDGGYHSDGPPRRKKGTPWTEEEHRQFLAGLQNLGKGYWKGISENYVPSRTPSQIASHAQKYFIRQSNTSTRKRRSSLFDMGSRKETRSPWVPLVFSSSQASSIINPKPRLDLSLKPDLTPSPFQQWPPTLSSFKNYGEGSSHHQILRPNPDAPKELVDLSRLSLEERETVKTEPTLLSLRLPGQP
ncbi:hypothetical protein ACJIZ3_020429 [Penstemon smallii]|uniref:Uncharacterized protein n=1 Tax=Penstemon smallii TaxID=265156 RepID=A0ABD3SIV9_9LAMI